MDSSSTSTPSQLVLLQEETMYLKTKLAEVCYNLVTLSSYSLQLLSFDLNHDWLVLLLVFYCHIVLLLLLLLL